MGVFQSVGGAATSGKGLNDAHIRSAILAALKASEEMNAERRKEIYEKIVAGETASALLEAGDYTAEQATSCDVNGSVKTENAPDAEVEEDEELNASDADALEIVEYAPDVFAALRNLSGTKADAFKGEWMSAPPAANTAADVKQRKMELGEGRSGALFLKSKSMAFMCKTISETEVQVLLSILDKYLAFMEKNPQSMLMRFAMLLRVTLKGEVGYVLCFADCFSNCNVLHERWDLKGRKPKPGKFRHFLKHDLKQNTIQKIAAETVNKDDESDSSTDSEFEAPKKASVINIRTADSRKALKLLTSKDKNLARLFWLEPQSRTELMGQFHEDFNFLFECGLMDYSILIGVRYNTQDETTRKEIQRDQKTFQPMSSPAMSMRQTFALGDEQNVGAFEVRGEEESEASQPAPNVNTKVSKFHRGVDNLECVETYYIGIIDMLTTYNAKKRTANCCKSCLWRENTLSTIPPNPYKERIEKYAHQIFPLVVVEDEDAPNSPTGITGKHDKMVKIATLKKKSSPPAAEPEANKKVQIQEPVKDEPSANPPPEEDQQEAFLMATQYPGENEDDYVEATALHEAAVKGDVSGIKLLIQKQEDLNCQDSSGRTPLHHAVKAGKLSAVKALIEAKVAINIEDRNGHTPLHVAALEGGAKIARALIAADADLDAQDRAGCTPLHLAVENYNQDVVKVLINARANLNLLEEEGLTPLKCAMNNGDDDMIDLLRQSGALEEVKPSF